MGYNVIADKFEDIQIKISAMSDSELEEQIKKTIRFELILEDFDKVKRKFTKWIL